MLGGRPFDLALLRALLADCAAALLVQALPAGLL